MNATKTKAHDTTTYPHEKKYGWLSIKACTNYFFLAYLVIMLTFFALSPEWFSSSDDGRYLTLDKMLKEDGLVILLVTVANFTLAATDFVLSGLWLAIRTKNVKINLNAFSDKFIIIFFMSGTICTLMGISLFIGYYKLILFLTPALLYYSWTHAFGLARDLWRGIQYD